MKHTFTLSVDVSYDDPEPPANLLAALHVMSRVVIEGESIKDQVVESKVEGLGWKLHWLKEEA